MKSNRAPGPREDASAWASNQPNRKAVCVTADLNQFDQRSSQVMFDPDTTVIQLVTPNSMSATFQS